MQGQGRIARRHAAQYKGQPEAAEEEEEVDDLETHLIRPPGGEGPNQNSSTVVEENGYLSQFYMDMVHQVKSIRKLVNKRRLIQDAADDSADWSSISCQLHAIDASFNKLLEYYDDMEEKANNTRCLIRSHGGILWNHLSCFQSTQVLC